MLPTAEWLDELAKALRNGRSLDWARHGGDSRKYPRVGVRLRANAILSERGKPDVRFQIYLRDFAPQGVAITCRFEMSSRQRFIIEVPLSAGGNRRILCEVQHCRRISDELYAIGASFISSIAPTVEADSAPIRRRSA